MADEHPTAEPSAAERPPRQRWRDRAFTFWSMVAVAVVAVLVGGIAGMALANATDDRGHDRFGPGMMGRDGQFQRGPMMRPPGNGFGHRFGHRFVQPSPSPGASSNQG